MRFLTGLVLAAVGVMGNGALAADAKYTLSGENTKVEFTGTKKDGKHTGGFKTLAGSVTVPGGDVTKAAIEVTIETASIYSDNAGLTGHLKNKDFFDVETNKTSTFKSTKLEKDGAGYKVTGDLTLNGKTKSISFPAKVSESGGSFTLTSEFKIDRTEFGMTYGAGKVDNDVALKIEVKAKK
jgi:polyisoprenoid-binding protein YceI